MSWIQFSFKAWRHYLLTIIRLSTFLDRKHEFLKRFDDVFWWCFSVLSLPAVVSQIHQTSKRCLDPYLWFQLYPKIQTVDYFGIRGERKSVLIIIEFYWKEIPESCQNMLYENVLYTIDADICNQEQRWLAVSHKNYCFSP